MFKLTTRGVSEYFGFDEKLSAERQALLSTELSDAKLEDMFVVPNLTNWDNYGTVVPVGEKHFLVAPENIVSSDGCIFWRFEEALIIGDAFMNTGWRLPSPLELSLICMEACYDNDRKVIDARLLGNILDMEEAGYGYIINSKEKPLAHNEGHEVVFWTDTMVDHDGDPTAPDSAYVFRLTDRTGGLASYVIEDRAACVRLIRELTPEECDNIAFKKIPLS